jgi:pheromone shutdown protein TraB
MKAAFHKLFRKFMNKSKTFKEKFSRTFKEKFMKILACLAVTSASKIIGAQIHVVWVLNFMPYFRKMLRTTG